jgi:hypothetical protein
LPCFKAYLSTYYAFSNLLRASLTGDLLTPKSVDSLVSTSLSPGLIDPLNMAFSMLLKILSDKLRCPLSIGFKVDLHVSFWDMKVFLEAGGQKPE